MRYNPDTERGHILTIEKIAEQGMDAIRALPKPPEREFLWDCVNGGWVKNPNFIPSLV